MNVSLTNVDSVNAILQITVTNADYQEKLDNALKTFRKKANVPGFRPGTVPAGMVKKLHGKSILAEEINKIVGESLYGYIQENKLNVLGEPLPNEEKQQPLDFSVEGDFEFFFDLALAPEIKLDLSEKDKVTYYNIAIDDALVDKQIESYKANYGKYEKVEEGAKETDLIRGTITELENGEKKEGGIFVEAGILMPSYMKDEAEQAKFVGAKADDVIVFNPGKAYNGNETEIASMLHIDKGAVEAIAPEFSFAITEITRYKEADLDQELFDKIFGEGNVTSEADFRAKVEETISGQFAPDSDYKFFLDAKEYLENKIGDLQFPDAFLKRWLIASGEERTAESVEQEYPKIVKDLKFHLIKEQIAKDYDLKVENEDIKIIAKQAAKAQFAQYGMMNLPEEMVDNYANDMLKNKENARNLLDRAMENKIIDALKANLGVEEKTISLDEFRKFFEKEDTKEGEVEA
ncbi:MAG: trigger factor [Prevotella sp.]|jgi:trigger factor|nr:trigger factor [Prevotella sp.]